MRNLVKDLGIVFLFSLIFFYLGSWVVLATSPDEGKNLYASLHMLRSGDYLTPYYNCHVRFEKPPLFYWLTALSFHIFGVSEYTIRLVSFISTFLTAIVIYFITRDFFDSKKALLSSLIFTLFIHNWVESKSATPEMLLVLFSTLSVYFLLKRKHLLAWFSLSLAFLSKGPVGFFLPLGVYFVWKLIESIRNENFWKAFFKILWDLIKFLLSPLGNLIFLVFGLGWYIAMFLTYDVEYIYKFFIEENIARFLGQTHQHPYPFWYYIPIVLVSIIFFIPIIFRIYKNFKKEYLPLLGWFGLVFTFYSLSYNKLHHYILFAYPPLAILFAHYISLKYLKRVFIIATLLLGLLLIKAEKLNEERFTTHFVEFLLNNQTASKILPELKFYKSENSAVVFYTYLYSNKTCIPQMNKYKVTGKEQSAFHYFITREKYLKYFPSYQILIKGNEFGKKEVLVQVP
jgi:4-amino-4-deoxy-L-arabinose transferase-like glycosyltransferase